MHLPAAENGFADPTQREVPQLAGVAIAQRSWAARRWVPALTVILVTGFVARLLYLNQLSAFPFFDQPFGDSAAHLRRAHEIAAGKILPSEPFYYSSIYYPYLLAVALGVVHGSLYWICMLQIVAGTAVVALIASLTRRVYGPRAGLAAAALAALYGPFAFLEADLLGVVWGQLSLIVAMLACVSWLGDSPARSKRAPVGLPLVAGLAFGITAIERANLLPLAVPAALWCAMHVGIRRAIRPLLAFGAGVAVPLAMVLALSVAGTGQWAPSTIAAGINVSLGYHRGATGTFDEPWYESAPDFAARHIEPAEAMVARASQMVGRPLTPREASDYWMKQAMDFIRTHPREAAFVTFRKAALLLNNSEVPNHLDFEFIRARALSLWLMPVGFALVFALAVIGAGVSFRNRRRRGETAFLLLMFAGAFASVLPFTVTDRYRAPTVLALIVLAGVGVNAAIAVARDRAAWRRTSTVLLATGALVAAAISLVPLFRPMRGRDYWIFADAYASRGQLRLAASEYEAALREEGDHGEMLNNLALVYKRMGERDRAIATLRRAIVENPRLAFSHKNLGMLLAAQGASAEAIDQLRAAERIDPNDAQTLGMLGALLAERGDAAAAREAFARAGALAPGDARLAALIDQYAPKAADRTPNGRAAGANPHTPAH